MGDLMLSWLSHVCHRNAEGSAKHGVTMQKDFYYIKFYFNFILTETIFETNVALNINEIGIYKFQIFLIKDRQKKEFKSV